MDNELPTPSQKKRFKHITGQKQYHILSDGDPHVPHDHGEHKDFVSDASSVADTDDGICDSRMDRVEKRVSSPENVGNCWMSLPDEPFGLGFYLSSRGQSTLHVYLWIAKDLTWVQGWYYEGIVIGGLAVSLNIFCLAKSAYYRDIGDTWSFITEFFWLFANYWWMIGEVHDSQFPNEKEIYDQHAHASERIMTTALVWASLYYIILKPCGWNTSANKSGHHEKSDLVVRFPAYFQSWDEYENTHSLLWSGKDTAWVWSNKNMWLIFFFPTAFVSVDFVWLSLYRKDMLIEHAHYLAQLLWMIANAVWAAGEFFVTPNHDEPLNMNRWSSQARVTSRWYSSWVVVLAFLPLVILYCIWIPATILGKIPPKSCHTKHASESVLSSVEMSSSAIGSSNDVPISPVHIFSTHNSDNGHSEVHRELGADVHDEEQSFPDTVKI